MYEKVLAAMCTITTILIAIWWVCRRGPDGRTGTGTRPDTGRVGNDIEATRQDANRAADDNRAAREDNRRAQQLVQKAKSILGSAKHTDSNS